MIYKCDLCNYETHDLSHYGRHKKSKKHLKKYEHNVNKISDILDNNSNTLTNIYLCKYCQRTFKHKSSHSTHQTHRCKIKKQYENKINNYEEEIELLREENELLKKENTKLTEIINAKPYYKIKNTRKIIPKTVKTSVWNKNIGQKIGEHECYIGCGKMITQSNFECGHIISEKNGGEIIVSNLKPICSECNKSMGVQNLEEFKQTFFPHNNLIN